MDFEKIVEFLPVAVTIWRLDLDLRADELSTNEFRLIYANASASKEAEIDMFELIGHRLDSIPPGIAVKYPVVPDLWARALIKNKPEKISHVLNNRTFEVLAYPIDARCVVSVFKNITDELVISQKATQSLRNIKSVEKEFEEYRKRKSGLFPAIK